MRHLFAEIQEHSLIAIAVKIVMLLAGACCSGCLEASAGPAAKPEAAIDFSQLLDDAEGHSRVPALPDDLKPVPETGTLPPPAAPVDRPSEPVPQPTVGTDPGAATLPVVLVYGPKVCAPCNRCIKELNESKRYSASKAAITPAIQAIADKWNQSSFPLLMFKDLANGDRFVVPYRGLRDFEIRYKRTMTERAASGMTPISSPPGIELVAPSFDVRQHLVERHGFTTAQVARMSDYECEMAHNAAHQVWGGFTGKRPGRLARRGKL